MTRIDWGQVLVFAREIVSAYDLPPTLRQLFYRLVAELLIPNTETAYKGLSRKTAAARREGWFPALTDRTRGIDRPFAFTSPEAALGWLMDSYRRDRTEGQSWNIYLGIEKDALAALLSSWFTDRGLPVVALRGYASQTLADEVREEVERDGRPAILLYAGDFDATGTDIDRDWLKRTDCWSETVRVALTSEQVSQYHLPHAPGKATDSRARRFVDAHGSNVQVELDALPPDVLHQLFEEALEPYWDESAFDATLTAEERDRGTLVRPGFRPEGESE